MDKINWYFKQPVPEEDVNFAFNAVEASVRNALKDGEQPFGIVSGYDVGVGTGLDLEISGTSVAYDRYGRRIAPTIAIVTQSVAAATDGGTSAVAGGGNERWVSVFARGGRKFADAVIDGNGISKRKTVTDVLNALGDADHPAGAYDDVAAKEAGVNKFYVTVGTEASIGTAERPTLIDDGVLVADVRMLNGVSTVTTAMIYLDRRQVLVPSWLRANYLQQGLFGLKEGAANYGVESETGWFGQDNYSLYVFGGSGYVYKDGQANQARRYTHYTISEDGVVVQWPPPNDVLPRQDLLCTDFEGKLTVVPGVAGTDFTGSIPSDSIVLAEVRALSFADAADSTTWPVVRRSFRRLPYPYSTQTGIIEGCRLAWKWTISEPFAVCYLASKSNKVAFNGEVVEFAGGFASADNTMAVPAVPDTDHNPYVGGAGADVPYYLYVCRGEFWGNATGTNFGPVALIASSVYPDASTGHPSISLRGLRGLLATTDCLLVGVGWSANGGMARPAFQSDDGWFTPSYLVYPNVSPPQAGTDLQIQCAPGSVTMDRVRIRADVKPGVANDGSPTTLQSILDVRPYLHGDFGDDYGSMRLWYGPPLLASAFPFSAPTMMTLGESEFPASGGYTWMAGRGYWEIHPLAFHMNLPRINFGGY